MLRHNYHVGDVVNLLCPNQEDSTKATYRPVMVVENLQDEILAVFMTCQTQQEIHYENSFVVPMNSPDGKLMGLTCNCLICPSRTVQLRKIVIHSKRGVTPSHILNKVLELVSPE